MNGRQALASSALAQPEALPLWPAKSVLSFGPTLVVAPHPDDESLGCGGAIALLRRHGLPVTVLVMSDGTRSHPRSRRYPRPALRALREQEALAAAAQLGVPIAALTFLRLPDRAVPAPAAPGFAGVVERSRALIAAIQPQTVLLPWRRDPHPDHRATWSIIDAALGPLDWRPRRLEYPIWLWELADTADVPDATEAAGWRLDIGAARAQKQAAIACHRSQTTNLIDDDPEGFRLTPEILAHFGRTWELYLEASDGNTPLVSAAELL